MKIKTDNDAVAADKLVGSRIKELRMMVTRRTGKTDGLYSSEFKVNNQ